MDFFIQIDDLRQLWLCGSDSSIAETILEMTGTEFSLNKEKRHELKNLVRGATGRVARSDRLSSFLLANKGEKAFIVKVA